MPRYFCFNNRAGGATRQCERFGQEQRPRPNMPPSEEPVFCTHCGAPLVRDPYRDFVGLDFGTSTSGIAILDQGKPVMLTLNNEGAMEELLASIINFDPVVTEERIQDLLEGNLSAEEQEEFERDVERADFATLSNGGDTRFHNFSTGGDPRKHALIHNPPNGSRQFYRCHIGAPAKSYLMIRGRYPGTVRSIKRDISDLGRQAPRRGLSLLPEEIAAYIIRKLLRLAEDYLEKKLGQRRKIVRAVITRPYGWSLRDVAATKRAAYRAGLRQVVSGVEPFIAALYYARRDNLADKLIREKTTARIVAFDFGGGTLDVSVVEVALREKEIECQWLGGSGARRLGGDDFDLILYDYLATECDWGNLRADDYLNARGDPTDTQDYTNALLTLLELSHLVEPTKLALSDPQYATQPYTVLWVFRNLPKDRMQVAGQEVSLNLQLFRSQYEKMIEPKVDQAFETLNDALKSAGLQPEDIDYVYLVGGTSKTPLVEKRMDAMFPGTNRFGEERVVKDPDRDLSVALGAAVWGRYLEEAKGLLPYAIGWQEGPFFRELIPRGTPLPIRQQRFRVPLPERMNPPVRFDLYQELRPNRARSINDRDYLMVAQVELPAHGLPDRRAGATLEFSVNHEGLFEVTAECTINGRLERSETISTAVD